MSETIKVITTRRLPPQTEARLTQLFDCSLRSDDTPMGKAALIEAALSADVLVPTISDRIDREVIAAGAARGLKLIASDGAGLDHIDLAAAREWGIPVTHTPGALTEDTADMAMVLILALFRRIAEAREAVRDDQFTGWSPTWMLGRSVHGKKLGILGMGRIGQALARRARAFGLSIHYHNRRPVSEPIRASLEAQYWPSLDQMLASVDVLSIHCPHTPGTYHLMSRRRLALMQPHAYVVNTARGEIVDENALAEALHARRLGGAALDVFAHEPDIAPALKSAPGILLTPHIGSATLEAREAMGEVLAINIRVWQSGETPPNLVLPEA